MKSYIVQLAAARLLPVTLILSLLVFYRGHNEPGGGFIGGLMAAAGFIFYAMAFDTQEAEKKLRVSPLMLIVAGLSFAFISTLPSLFSGNPFFTGEWISLSIPLLGKLKLGTPLLFDFGVYLTVWGVIVTIIFNVMEE
ncbi:MAG: Na(+)/H(+) antiporter subunit B [Bacteroidetes bacterium HGW-Bacteroidetes-11]|jgi:multicomponent Na+:H+ antiporter subunit B|nr:MAG: Na(+)/H(+) antiporter subunit B [Bacteroidetes bacterium HGW-Bacteroidetes-11]